MAVVDGDVLRVLVSINMPNLQLGANVYYWQLSDPTPDSPSDAAILSALEQKLTDMYNHVDQEMSDAYNIDDLRADIVEWDGTKWETTSNVGEALIDIDGTGAGDAVPHGCSMVVTARTSRPQTRARKFLPGLLEANTEDSTLSAAVLTALGNFAAAWLADKAIVGAADLVPVVLGQSGPSAGSIFPLAVSSIPSIVGYQRRRKPGVGT